MQRYEYGDAREAVAERGDDASRVISFFIFNTEVHFHAYASDGQSVSDPAVSRRLDTALAAACISSTVCRARGPSPTSVVPIPARPRKSASRPRRPTSSADLWGIANAAAGPSTSRWGR